MKACLDLISVEQQEHKISKKFHGYLPLSPVFVGEHEVELIVGVLCVDLVDPGHQVGQVNSVAQHPKEDVVWNICHHLHA